LNDSEEGMQKQLEIDIDGQKMGIERPNNLSLDLNLKTEDFIGMNSVSKSKQLKGGIDPEEHNLVRENLNSA